MKDKDKSKQRSIDERAALRGRTTGAKESQRLLEKKLQHLASIQGQIESILITLASKAQDAMPDGEELTIEMTNVNLKGTAAERYPQIELGLYVLLPVSNMGRGMIESDKRSSEPFFITKGIAREMGLASVFDDVGRSGGAGRIGERSDGATIEIYLPRTDDRSQRKREEDPPPGEEEEGDGERILMVEDDEAVRRLIERALKEQGYDVLTARSGEEALERARDFETPFHLLLTDVVLPGMSGKVLRQRLQHDNPGVKVLYISGYPIREIGPLDCTPQTVRFLSKPFSMTDLQEVVRQLLKQTTNLS